MTCSLGCYLMCSMCVLSSLDSSQCELRYPTVSHQTVITWALKTFQNSCNDSITKHFALPSESPSLGQFMTLVLIVKICYCNLERLLKQDITVLENTLLENTIFYILMD